MPPENPSLTDRLAALTPQQRALLELRLKQKGRRPDDRASVPRRPDPSDTPLSVDQERLWFIAHMAPDNAAYNINSGTWLDGPLDVGAFERAIHEIVRRHESLRTTFSERDGQPFQTIHDHVEVEVAVRDLSRVAEDNRDAAVQHEVDGAANAPFDLERGPLVRVTLIRPRADEHLLLVTMHHIVTDRVSFSVLQNELSQLYNAYRDERPSPLAELPIQYADYAAWQRRHLSGDRLDRLVTYWQHHFDDASYVLELPTDHPRPPVQSFRGERRALSLPEPLRERLKALAHGLGASPFMLYLAAFGVFLSRYSGQRDLVISTPIANRQRSNTQNLIGFLLNMLAIRVRLEGNPTFRQLLERVRAVAVDAYAHQDLSFGKLVEILDPPRDLSRNPVFQTSLIYLDANEGELEMTDLSVRPLRINNEGSRFDLTLAIWESPRGLDGFFEYCRDLWEPDSIDRMIGHLERLLESIATDPDRSIESLPWLAPDERRLLTVDWNRTHADLPRDTCLHQRFERQARAHPDRVAAVDAHDSITYGSLDRRAEHLATTLQRSGVGPDVHVGLHVDRSLDVLVGILGILKAGGAYVPLDPAYPPQRVELILNDCGASIVVTSRSLASQLPSSERQVVLVDDACDEPAVDTGHVTPRHAAYVIYTSGSTGRPKGVVIEHRNAVALVDWAGHAYADDELSGMLASTSICFDLSIFEIFGALSHGGRIILARDALHLHDHPAAGEVTLINTVPSVMSQLLDLGRLPSSVLTVNLAGEPLQTALVDRIYAESSARKVYDLYGPTEATTYVTGTLRQRGASATIGRPIANTTAYILDDYLEPVPVGVPGQLYVGGAQVARGYWNRPELTAENFLADPFGASADEASRLYRTGDLARFLPDGRIEFLGRMDDQVKLRGYRVEPGEIEAALVEHDDVREAAVIVRDGSSDADRQLVAYVATRIGATDIEDALRRHLGACLPDYMIPSIFMTVDALPLTPSGKVDRKALPVPEASRRAARSDAPPETETQQRLAAIWQRLLGVERIGLHDNFFALGGHSLIATQVVSRVRGELHRRLELRSVFERPTIAALAEVIDDAGEAPETGSTRADREDDIPLSFAQQRLWFLQQLDPQSRAYHVPAAVRIEGPLDADTLASAFGTVVARHEVLRTTFPAHRGRPRQRIATDMALPLSIEAIAEGNLAGRMDEEASTPFDLDAGPLIRTRLYRIGDDRHVLQITMHHLVCDGWSYGILFRELAEAYRGASDRKPTPLTFQYADFAVAQHEWFESAESRRQLDFWRAALADDRPVRLPSDRPRPAVQTFRGGSVTRVLPRRLLDLAEKTGRTRQSTLFMTLLAAYMALLQRHSLQDRIVVGTPNAGRDRQETESLIGLFVNMLVVGATIDSDTTFHDLVEQVREVALAAYAHQQMPFEKLVEHVRPQRDLARNPLFQVTFALQDFAPGTGSASLPPLGDATMEPVGIEARVARFDLEAFAWTGKDGLHVAFVFNEDLFERPTIERLIEQFAVLLEAALAQPDRPLGDIDLLPEGQRRLLLVDWNRTEASYPRDARLHELFETQVDRQPDATALVDHERRLTYAELDGRANQLAHDVAETLGRAGDAPLVGICIDRGVDMIVAILAVLKAGAAYVALDPAYPAQRIAFMLEDTRAPLLLTEQRYVDQLPRSAGDVCCVDRDWSARVEPRDRQRSERSGSSSDLAYVIYTSGSTGRPKGVAIEHRSAVALCTWAGTVYDRQDLGGVLASTSICFDLSIFELFVTLGHGGALILARNLLELQSLPAANEVTLINTVPSAIDQLITAGTLPRSVRVVNLAGEPLSTQLADRIYACGDGHVRRVCDLYGPSEDTTYSTFVHRQPGDRATIGRPIANTRIHLLDDRMRPVPLGVTGQLYIGGDGLARGYLHRPELTAERFVDDPFASAPGARLYRTGDLGRYLPDGRIEFLGRMDHQVKLRGYRIELGEIESVLGDHPSVRETVVVVRDDPPVGRRLVAYVVAADGEAVDAQTLRPHLRERIPGYMVPATYVTLDGLPRTANGKIDRAALPAPKVTPPMPTARPSIPPRDERERQVAEMWRELLGVADVSVDENFFDLGGHSLMLVELHSRLREKFAHELSVVDMFRYPTIRGLAERIGTPASTPRDRSAAQRAGKQQEALRRQRESLRRR
ncbi:MAG: non-ribosomal peptide synthetase [Phycisphaeraceae bacterium]|nr:non-ribosomal peptide synthetase [Phycisphaeraceae bacterium]